MARFKPKTKHKVALGVGAVAGGTELWASKFERDVKKAGGLEEYYEKTNKKPRKAWKKFHKRVLKIRKIRNKEIENALRPAKEVIRKAKEIKKGKKWDE